MDEDKNNQDEVLEEDSDVEVIENLQELCISCYERPQERKQRCGSCFFSYSQTNPNWRYEKD